MAGRRVLETREGFTGYAARRTLRTLMWGNIGLTAVASYASGSWSPQDLSGYAGWVSLLLVAASSVPALSRRVGDLSVTGPEEGVDAMLANPVARRLLGRHKKP